jgi:hypothetical protein
MFRMGGGGGWRMVRAAARTSKKAAKATDKAMPGAGMVNAASVAVGLCAMVITAPIGSALLAPIGARGIGLLLGIGAAVGIGAAFNAWMVAGVANLQEVAKAFKEKK